MVSTSRLRQQFSICTSYVRCNPLVNSQAKSRPRQHITALPGPHLAKIFTVAEKTHLDAHHTPSFVHSEKGTYSNRLENLFGDGEVTLATRGSSALYILADELFEILEKGMRVEARAVITKYRGDAVEIGVTKIAV